jgi:hypothetical protein
MRVTFDATLRDSARTESQGKSHYWIKASHLAINIFIIF